MSRTRKSLTAAVLAATVAVPAALVTTTPAQAAPAPTQAVGLVDGTRLIQFALARPGQARPLATLRGFSAEGAEAADTRLVGIDYRVQDKQLYGVGDNGGVYVVARSGQLTYVNRLSVALDGETFGVDFNPAADRLRIISDTGQNLRHNVNAGGTTIDDGTLTYTAADGSTSTATGVTAAAYTNNDLSADTGTFLFDIDTTLDQLVLQQPANNGTLALVGKTGVPATADTGFDIDTANRGWATMAMPGRYRLYSVDLQSGVSSPRGVFPRRSQPSDIAVPIR